MLPRTSDIEAPEKEDHVKEAKIALAEETLKQLLQKNKLLKVTMDEKARNNVLHELINEWEPFESSQEKQHLERVAEKIAQNPEAIRQLVTDVANQTAEVLSNTNFVRLPEGAMEQITKAAKLMGLTIAEGTQTAATAQIVGRAAKQLYEKTLEGREHPKGLNSVLKTVSTTTFAGLRALYEWRTGTGDYVADMETWLDLNAKALSKSTPKTRKYLEDGAPGNALATFFVERHALLHPTPPESAVPEELEAMAVRAAEVARALILEKAPADSHQGMEDNVLIDVAAIRTAAELLFTVAQNLQNKETKTRDTTVEKLKAASETDGKSRVFTIQPVMQTVETRQSAGEKDLWLQLPTELSEAELTSKALSVTQTELETAIREALAQKLRNTPSAANRFQGRGQTPENMADGMLNMEHGKRVITDPTNTVFEGCALVTNMLHEAGISTKDIQKEFIGHLWATYIMHTRSKGQTTEELVGFVEGQPPETRVVLESIAITLQLKTDSKQVTEQAMRNLAQALEEANWEWIQQKYPLAGAVHTTTRNKP